jgi:hypothetical protein
MSITEIIAALDDEIKRLQQVRDLCQTLIDTDMQPWLAHKLVAKPGKKYKRKLSAEGRERIAEAQRKRWKQRGQEIEQRVDS